MSEDFTETYRRIHKDFKMNHMEYYLRYAHVNSHDNATLEQEYNNILLALEEAYQAWQHGILSRDVANSFIESVNKFARFLGYRANFQERVKWGKRTLEVAERDNHRLAIAELSASVIAWPLLQLGEWEQAKVYAQKGMDAALQCQSPRWAGEAARTLSGIARDQQQADEAKHWAKMAFVYARQSRHTLLKKGAILDLAYAAMVAHNFIRAERLFRVLVELAQEDNDRERAPERMGDLALAILNQHRLKEARKLFEDARPMVEVLNNDIMKGELAFSLAKIEQLLGNDSRAKELALEGRRIFELLGVKRPPRAEQFTYLTHSVEQLAK
jgi:tetratricopeptide (TPR) repeat protein